MVVKEYRWVGWVVGALVIIVSGAYLWFTEGKDLKEQLGGYSLSETLPEVIDADGEGARVVSLLDDGGNVSFEVLTGDTVVKEHYFGRVCTPGVSGGDCGYRKTNGEHPASATERKAARAMLGDIDEEVPDRLRKEAKAPDSTRVGLRGNRWVVSLGATPQIANLDGSGLHPARSRAELAAVKSVSEDAGTR